MNNGIPLFNSSLMLAMVVIPYVCVHLSFLTRDDVLARVCHCMRVAHEILGLFTSRRNRNKSRSCWRLPVKSHVWPRSSQRYRKGLARRLCTSTFTRDAVTVVVHGQGAAMFTSNQTVLRLYDLMKP